MARDIFSIFIAADIEEERKKERKKERNAGRRWTNEKRPPVERPRKMKRTFDNRKVDEEEEEEEEEEEDDDSSIGGVGGVARCKLELMAAPVKRPMASATTPTVAASSAQLGRPFNAAILKICK